MFKRISLAILLILVVWIAYEWLTFPDVRRLTTQNPETTSFMELRRKQLRREGKDDTLLYHWAPYGSISPTLRRAVLVSEDSEFYEHSGVDMEAMKEALRKDWNRRKITQGGSTITQQLAKNLYLSPSRNPLRKIREYVIARRLEDELSKKRILELYLNVVEFGERVYGADAAARFYFKVPASALSVQQSALLAGSLPNPRVMNPGSPNKRLRARQRIIVSRMRRWGYLFEKEVLISPKPEAQSKATPPEPASPATDTDLAPPTETDTTATTEPPPEPEPAAPPPPTQTDTQQ